MKNSLHDYNLMNIFELLQIYNLKTFDYELFFNSKYLNMKTHSSNFESFLIALILGLIFPACTDSNLDENNVIIESRSPDPDCDICDQILVSHCCCFVENAEDFSLDLHICGVIGSEYGSNAESCSMYVPFGPPCTQVNNMGVTAVVAGGDRLYFCIATNAPFSICNANGSGDGHIRVGCSGSYMPSGSIGENLDYLSGGYCRYFTTSGCDVQAPCNY